LVAEHGGGDPQRKFLRRVREIGLRERRHGRKQTTDQYQNARRQSVAPSHGRSVATPDDTRTDIVARSRSQFCADCRMAILPGKDCRDLTG
jgi:hypothetical protein